MFLLVAAALAGQQPSAGGVEQSRPLHKVPPVYPAEAKAKGVCGSVRVRFLLGTDGIPGPLTVISGPPELEKETARVVSQWRYTPYQRDGVPVALPKIETVNFNLNRPAEPAKPCYHTPPAALKVTPETLNSMLVRSPRAELSREDRRQNVTPGTVRLHLEIDDAGRIVDLGFISGPQELQWAALEAVGHWVYNPYLKDGQPTAIESTVDVDVR